MIHKLLLFLNILFRPFPFISSPQCFHSLTIMLHFHPPNYENHLSITTKESSWQLHVNILQLLYPEIDLFISPCGGLIYCQLLRIILVPTSRTWMGYSYVKWRNVLMMNFVNLFLLMPQWWQLCISWFQQLFLELKHTEWEAIHSLCCTAGFNNKLILIWKLSKFAITK